MNNLEIEAYFEQEEIRLSKMSKIDRIIEQNLKGFKNIVLGSYSPCGWLGSSKKGSRSGEREHRIDAFELWFYGKKTYAIREELKQKGYQWNASNCNWFSKPITSYEELVEQIELYKKYLTDISVKIKTSDERFISCK